MTTLYETDLVGTNHILSLLSFIAIFFAIYIIISKNPVVSVLFLIGLFFSISLYLISIGFHFLGLVYLIVYVGAVSILFLFILMLINVRVSELLSDSSNSFVLAIVSILAFFYSINNALPFNVYLHNIFDIYNIEILNKYLGNILTVQLLNNVTDTITLVIYSLSLAAIGNVSSKMWDGIIVNISHIMSIGNILYTNYFILFIITSLVLLLAMVGAIIITINKSKIKNEWNLSTPSGPYASSSQLQSAPVLFYALFYKNLVSRSLCVSCTHLYYVINTVKKHISRKSFHIVL